MKWVNTDKIGFCWIPTLSGNIFSTKHLEFLEFIKNDQFLYPPDAKDSIDPDFYQNRIWVIEFDPNRLDEIINLSLFETTEDNDGTNEDEISSIVEFQIKSISKTGFIAFDISLNEALFNAIIDNDVNSVILSDELESSQESKEVVYEQIKTELLKKIIYHFYFLIREIYHIHTHHDKNHQLRSENLDLLPIFITTKDNVVGKTRSIISIADSFKEKIPIYHEYINSLREVINQKKDLSIESIERNKDSAFNNWLEIIRIAIGEMLYAQQFVLEHCNDYLSNEYNFIFENAIKSFNSIFSEINAQYQHDEQIIQRSLQKQMKTYTIVVIFLTLTSTIFGIISCINNKDSIFLNNYHWLFCLISLFIIGIGFFGFYDNSKYSPIN